MKIGIIGKGFVGSALGKVLSKKYKIVYYDKYKKRYNNPDKLKDCNIIFVCVPTPMNENGSIDLGCIKESTWYISYFNENPDVLFVIKSTVTPGTCDWLAEEYNIKVASNPEFLKQKTALQDMKNPSRIVIGKYHKELYKLYKPLFPKTKFVFTTNKEAEMIKYASNVMLASQVGIANELYRICKKLKIDYNKVKEAMLLDSRIGRNINVPGPDGKTGFGGACFPKDLNALIYHSKKNGYTPYLLEEVWRSND